MITGAGAVFNSAKVEVGADVAVIGCGGVGLSAVNGAALAGAGRIIAIDTLASKLELAKKVGKIVSYGDTTHKLTADELEKCNTAAGH